MKGNAFLIFLCCLQYALAATARGAHVFVEPDEIQPWLENPKATGVPQQCTITIYEPKKVTGHCVALGAGGTTGCMSGDTIIPFHPDC